MNATEPTGSLGGTAGRATRDTRFVERASRERWPIAKVLRGPPIERLARIAQDPDASPREATAAARAILTASKINVDLIGATIQAEEHEELSDRVAQLGQRLAVGRPTPRTAPMSRSAGTPPSTLTGCRSGVAGSPRRSTGTTRAAPWNGSRPTDNGPTSPTCLALISNGGSPASLDLGPTASRSGRDGRSTATGETPSPSRTGLPTLTSDDCRPTPSAPAG
jgi:hypothetical protein